MVESRSDVEITGFDGSVNIGTSGASSSMATMNSRQAHWANPSPSQSEPLGVPGGVVRWCSPV